MNVLCRAWRVYAAPAGSEAAMMVKGMIPIEIAAWLYLVLAPEDWSHLSGSTLLEIGLWSALLWFIRQRDEARAEVKRTSTASQTEG